MREAAPGDVSGEHWGRGLLHHPGECGSTDVLGDQRNTPPEVSRGSLKRPTGVEGYPLSPALNVGALEPHKHPSNAPSLPLRHL